MADALKKLLRLLCIAGLVLLSGGPAASGDERAEREGPVKAAFLFNFAAYTTWPGNAFAGANSPIVIGIVGRDLFNGAVERAVQSKLVAGHPFTVAHFENASRIRACHILFVCESESDSVGEILQRAGNGTLTVGDFEGFTDKGGIIRLYPDDTKVKFEVNMEALGHSRVRISSRLLKLAKLVHE